MAPFEIAPDKILRFPDELERLKEGTPPSVLNVEVDLSETCQLACASCDFPNHYPAHMNLDLAGQTASTLERWGTKAVVFSGGGEPTMCPDFAPITALFGQSAQLGLYTNGVRSVFADVADRFRWVFVSLDAASADEWAAYKRAPASWYAKVLENIGAAAQGTTVGVGFLIGEHNYQRIETMARVGLEAGASYVRFRPMYPSQGADWQHDAIPILERVSAWEHVSVAWHKFHDVWQWERPYDTCWASMFLRLVDAEGTVWACPTTRGKRRLGNIATYEGLRQPLAVTDECRPCCRGHEMNLLLDYVMRSGPHDYFV